MKEPAFLHRLPRPVGAPLLAAYRGWMTFSHALGWVNGRILLTALYILVIGPYAIARKISSHLRPPPPKASFWRERKNETPTIDTLRRLFS